MKSLLKTLDEYEEMSTYWLNDMYLWIRSSLIHLGLNETDRYGTQRTIIEYF